MHVRWGVALRAPVQGPIRHRGAGRRHEGEPMTDTRYAFYVGIDWASAAHQVVVLDHERRPVADRSVAHTGAALDECATWLATMAAGHSEQVGIAIEVPRGAVVETLLERGFHVFAINPKQLDRFRDRHTVAGAKDDRRDGLVLADSLATDQPAFRRLRPEEPAVIQLRELTRVDEDLQDEERRLSKSAPRAIAARLPTASGVLSGRRRTVGLGVAGAGANARARAPAHARRRRAPARGASDPSRDRRRDRGAIADSPLVRGAGYRRGGG